MPEPDRRLLKQLHAKMATAQVHWTLMDAALPPDKPLVVLEDVDRAAFSALGVTLQAQKAALDTRLLEEKLVWGGQGVAKAALHARFRWFQQHTRAEFPASVWARVLPLAPSVTDGFDIYMEAMRKGAYLWLRLAAEQPPSPNGPAGVLPDGYMASDFDRDTKELVTHWWATHTAAFEVRLARGELKHTQARALAATQAYGHAVRSRLPAGHDLLRLLPPLWPSRAAAARSTPEVQGIAD